MKKIVVILSVLAVIATGCGNRGEDTSGSGTTSEVSKPGGSAASGDWGDLKGVCGPNEGGGKVAGDAQGVKADSIQLGTVADPGFSARQGLNQELFDAGTAFVAWCNKAGGINGKKINLTLHDAKFVEYRQAIEAACSKDFALVGGGGVQDNVWPEVAEACGLIDVAGFAVTAAKAGLAGQKPSTTRTIQAVPNPADRYAAGPALLANKKYPEAGKRLGVLFADYQTLIDQAAKEVQGQKLIGNTIASETAYNPQGEPNWKPFASTLKRDNISFMRFIGEPSFAGSLEQALKSIGYVPTVRLYDTNFYDHEFIESAGPAAEGALVGSAFAPIEEASTNPATQLYIDNLKASGGKQAILGVQSTSAWLLFATIARDCDRDDNLTRTCILEKGDAVKDWTGGGLHAPTQPGENIGSECWMVMQVKDGEFERWAPDKGFDCDPKSQLPIVPAK
ncbi:MAG: ABC transporter substrate-binding protein [Aquihabitans sp.]